MLISPLLGKIFKGATNKISNAAILSRIVAMIDKEKWVSMSSDVKGEIYEGLLQKNAEEQLKVWSLTQFHREKLENEIEALEVLLGE